MALTEKQKQELDLASSRLGTLNQGDKDQENIDFATKEHGYSYIPPVSGGVGSSIGVPNSSIVGSSNRLRDEESVVKSDASEVARTADELGIDDFTNDVLNSTTNTPEVQSAQNDLNAVKNALGITSSEEQAEIDEAGRFAGSQFDPLITEAEEERRKGLPTALIGAGERGGLLNSQFAGVAAIAPTEGGDFFGAGGKLEDIKSVYDRNIDNLQTKKINAISAAKSAARTAIRTGKKEDIQLAQDSLKLAQDANRDAIDLANEKLQVITDFENQSIKRIEFTQEQEDRAVETIAPSMVDVDENGEIVIASPEEIQAVAESYGIDPNLLLKSINEESAKLSKLQASERKAALDEAKNIKDLNKIDTQVVTVGGRKKIIDAQTGETLADLGSSTAPKSVTKETDEEQEQFDEDIRDWQLKLADPNNDITWGQAWDSMASIYPELKELAVPDLALGADIEVDGKTVPNQPLLDILLNKDKYFTK